MPCNPKKDLSRLVARTRIRIFTSRHFWDVYLWPDVDTMWRETAVIAASNGPHEFSVAPDTQEPAMAHVSRNFYVVRYARPWWSPLWLWNAFRWPAWLLPRICEERSHYWPRLGEIHLTADRGWDMETVSHETTHAAITSAVALGVSANNVFHGGPLSDHFKDTPVYRDAESKYQITINDEELYCYIHGMLFEEIYKWLWRVNPPYDSRRSEWSLP